MNKLYNVHSYLSPFSSELIVEGDFFLGQAALPVALGVSAIDPSADTLLGTLQSAGSGTVSIRMDWNTATSQYDAQITWGSSTSPTVQANNTIVSQTPWHAAGQYDFGGRLNSLQLRSSNGGLNLYGEMQRLGQRLVFVALNFQVAANAANWTYENFLDPLTHRNYRVLKAGNLGLADWTATAASPDTPTAVSCWACDLGEIDLMNQSARQAAAASATGGDALAVEFQNVITTSQWMTQTWHLISHMPAQEFIFVGCHDALASHSYTAHQVDIPGLISGVLSRLYTQTQSIGTMLADGCRFLDLRFTGVQSSSVATMYGVHPFEPVSVSSVTAMVGMQTNVKLSDDAIFNVTVNDVITALRTFFAVPNNKEIVFINLTLINFPNSITANDAYTQFANLLTANGIRLVDPQVVNPNDTLEAFKTSGDVILMIGNDNVSQPLPANQYWPLNFIKDAVSDWSSVVTPIQWFNTLLDSGDYLGAKTMLGDQQFCYLAMQQNKSDPGHLKGTMNGALSDWILSASPPVSGEPSIAGQQFAQNTIMALNCAGFQNSELVLPYKPFLNHQKQCFFRRNYNIIAVDFYEKGLFVINAIVQNLRVAQRISNGAQFIPRHIPPAGAVNFNPVANQQYSIVNIKSNKEWAVQGNSLSSGAYIIQYSINTGSNQRFYIESQGNGLFKFRSVSSNFYLTLKPAYDADANLIAGGDSVYEYWHIYTTANVPGAQIWTIVNSVTGMLLTIYQDGSSDGDSVVQYPQGGPLDLSHLWMIY